MKSVFSHSKISAKSKPFAKTVLPDYYGARLLRITKKLENLVTLSYFS